MVTFVHTFQCLTLPVHYQLFALTHNYSFIHKFKEWQSGGLRKTGKKELTVSPSDGQKLGSQAQRCVCARWIYCRFYCSGTVLLHGPFLADTAFGRLRVSSCVPVCSLILNAHHVPCCGHAKAWADEVGIVQWLERPTHDWKVEGLSPCRSGGRIFFSGVSFLCWLLF